MGNTYPGVQAPVEDISRHPATVGNISIDVIQTLVGNIYTDGWTTIGNIYPDLQAL